eukprot:CAMPEP_0196663924 /NCGR_PEP_ID=MMETSP1086-20130531/54827_1 /TAXON_ID=77921 /ORGANISM="Cyanoptyche  gloeocystis , Strain SAG4.97" /LENGTH=171 /DNA_ID=CAMNT_0041999947 /DNA_START=271 /DNA_END=786 /DNA_ORIENTATION=+
MKRNSKFTEWTLRRVERRDLPQITKTTGLPREIIEDIAENSREFQFVAEAERKLVGFVVVDVRNFPGSEGRVIKRGELLSMWVAPEARGHGVASTLIRATLATFSQPKNGISDLFTVTSNAELRAFLEHLNFRRDDSTKEIWMPSRSRSWNPNKRILPTDYAPSTAQPAQV